MYLVEYAFLIWLMKGVNDSNNLTKHIACECRCDFGGRVCDLRQKIEKR